jgi:hypothetical protein
MDNFLTISQVAKRVGVNPQTIRRWDKTGKFVSSRHPINNYRVYKYDQVERLLEELNPRKLEKHETSESGIENSPWFQTGWGKLYNLDVLDFLSCFPPNIPGKTTKRNTYGHQTRQGRNPKMFLNCRPCRTIHGKKPSIRPKNRSNW